MTVHENQTMSRGKFLGVVAGASASAAALASGWPLNALGGNGVLDSGRQAQHHPVQRPRPHFRGAGHDRRSLRLRAGLRAARRDRLQGDRVRRLQPEHPILGRQITPAEIRKPRRQRPGVGNGTPGHVTDTLATFEQHWTSPTSSGTHIGTGGDPTGSNFKADWDAAAERWNDLGEPPRPRPRAVHAQPRRGVQLPARQRPARRARPADPLLGHPQAGVLPDQPTPATSTSRWTSTGRTWRSTGSARTPTPTAGPGDDLRPARARRGATNRFPLFHAKDGARTPTRRASAPGT